MLIRNSVISELEDIMKVYENAKAFMRESGNFEQWIKGYPYKSLIADDIEQGNSYVCVEKEEIIGVFTFVVGIEPDYNVIEGKWTKDKDYGVIHRIGIKKRGINLGEACIRYCLKKCDYIRIDTHRLNTPMQKLLKGMGFNECGVIHLKDGSERIGYDKE